MQTLMVTIPTKGLHRTFPFHGSPFKQFAQCLSFLASGYIPRVSFYKAVIDALRDQGASSPSSFIQKTFSPVCLPTVPPTGQHERAVEVFTSGQALYKELTVRGAEVRPNVPDYYGVAAPQLVQAVLASCAEGTSLCLVRL